MEIHWRTSLWQQYGAAIDTLEDAIRLCPEHLWTVLVWNDPEDVRYGQFWFLVYHTLFWMDLFLTGSSEGFLPPPPFIRGALPDEPYTKEQLLNYMGECRSRARSVIETMTEERAAERCVFKWMEPSFLELQLYSMRHMQEHAAQLSLVLGQHGVTGMDWVASVRDMA